MRRMFPSFALVAFQNWQSHGVLMPALRRLFQAPGERRSAEAGAVAPAGEGDGRHSAEGQAAIGEPAEKRRRKKRRRKDGDDGDDVHGEDKRERKLKRSE